MEISLSAQKVHGISNDFLMENLHLTILPRILRIYSRWRNNNSQCRVWRNFINKELQNCGFNIKNTIIDTIKIAKKEFPGQTVSLDSLCKKLNVVNTSKIIMELLDATLLSKDIKINNRKTRKFKPNK